MQRRLFLAGGVASVIGVTSSVRLFAVDNPPVSDLKQSELTVGDAAPGGSLSNIQRIRLWEMNLEEDDNVRFYFRLTNTASRQVRIVHCQPWAANSWVRREIFGPFGQVNALDFYKAGWPAPGWRADNDSNAFYCLINNNGRWDVMQPSQGSNDNNTAHMEWENPQQVRFEVRSHDMR